MIWLQKWSVGPTYIGTETVFNAFHFHRNKNCVTRVFNRLLSIFDLRIFEKSWFLTHFRVKYAYDRIFDFFPWIFEFGCHHHSSGQLSTSSTICWCYISDLFTWFSQKSRFSIFHLLSVVPKKWLLQVSGSSRHTLASKNRI